MIEEICSRIGCDEPAKEVVKLLLFTKNATIPAEVFASIYACSEEHKAPDGDIHYFFKHNWALLEVAFAQRGFDPPILEKTLIAWLPIEDLEEFRREHAGADQKQKGIVTIN
jgi:hypothetical protein